MLDYLAIGHIARDLTPEGARLGGTATYAALTAHALGLRAGLLTATADDADLSPLNGLSIHRQPSPFSTTFENHYGPLGRTQFLRARAATLNDFDIPPDWSAASIVHLAPIAREVPPRMPARFPGVFIGLTPQGWLRQWDDHGRVSPAPWEDADSLLALASAVVISIEDVAGDWGLAEGWAARAAVLAVTEGERGATVFARGSRRRLPALVTPVVDATGAGDIFAAAFFVRLWQTADPWDAARSAVALASDSVTRVGIEGVPKQNTEVRKQNTEVRRRKW
ncbi:MAG: ribokinase [Chloroflexi bacterium]|nr:ribokinase [Chloroflexota bacterium]